MTPLPFWIKRTELGVELWKHQELVNTFLYSDYRTPRVAEMVALAACNAANGGH